MIVRLWEIDGTHTENNVRFNFMEVWKKCKRFVILKTSCHHGLPSFTPYPLSFSGVRKVRKFYSISVWNDETQHLMHKDSRVITVV
jgi:hypothetical protein